MKTKKWRWDSFNETWFEDVNNAEALGEDNGGELTHYGVLGMKWGVRRTPEQLGHKTNTKKTKYKVVVKSPFEKKMDKLAKKEQKIAEKEAIKAKKDELKFRKAELSNKSEKDAAKAKRAEERAKEKEAKAKAKEVEAKTNKQTNVPKNRDVKSISDEELSQILKRWNMEQQYAKMVEAQSQNGKAWFSKMITDVGRQVAQDYTKKAVVAAVEAAIEKAKRNRQRNSGGNSGSGGGP